MLTQTIRKLSTLVAISFFSTSLLLFGKGDCQAKTHSEADIDTYIEQLRDDRWQERSQAAYELGKIGGELGATSKVIVALIEALKDEDEVVRLRATFALVNIGQPAVLDLIAELDEQREEVSASVIFALRKIGLPAIPMLTEALRNENLLVRANAATAIAQIAEDFQYRVEVLSLSELQQVIIKLEETQEVIEKAAIDKGISVKYGISRWYVIIPSKIIEEKNKNIRQSINAIKTKRKNLILGIALNGILILVVGPVLIVVLVFWFRPELGLRLSRTILRAREKREIIDQLLPQVQQFLNQAGARTSPDRKYGLRVTSISGKIDCYTPLPVMVTTEQPIDRDVTELVQYSATLARNPQERAGIIIYREPPDAMFRIQMATVRLRDRVFVIPIPLAAVEQSLLDRTASGLLAEYGDRYLPGADLFDDRNAIGDTLSFFGRVELLNELEENLRRNQGIGLFGLRKSGKTSVLLQLGFAMNQHPVVHVDLQRCSQLHYGASLFNQILQQLSQLAEKGNLSRDTSSLFAKDMPASELTAEFVGRVSQLVKSLEKAGYQLPILCFLDEIERILPREADPKAKAEEFNACFGALRALSQEQRLLSLLVADVHPDCNRINHWSQAGVPTNPVYNFFKEVFVLPFSPEETKKMLADIGQLMGVQFDEETLAAIHRETGGHPFIARQLASLLYQKLAKENNDHIQWSAAGRYVTKPFSYSGLLKDYFKENIWADLNKRNFQEAIAILRLLACNETVAEGVLLARLGREFTESECIDALLWLEAVGLVSRRESDEGDLYQIEVPLMSRWLQMQMKHSEKSEWQIL